MGMLDTVVMYKGNIVSAVIRDIDGRWLDALTVGNGIGEKTLLHPVYHRRSCHGEACPVLRSPCKEYERSELVLINDKDTYARLGEILDKTEMPAARECRNKQPDAA